MIALQTVTYDIVCTTGCIIVPVGGDIVTAQLAMVQHIDLFKLVMQTLLTLTLISVMLFFMSEIIRNLERDEVRLLRRILAKLDAIYDLLKPALPILTQARIIIMPKTVNVGDSFNVTIAGLDQFGQPFPLDANYSVAYGASNPAAVQLPSPPQPDGSGVGTALAAEPAESISATITGPGGTITATADTLTINAVVVPPVLTSASVVIT